MSGRKENPAMAATNPYADAPTTPDPFISRVRKDLLSLEAAQATDANVIAVVAKEEVLALWPRPVKTFIPVLALRAARARLFPEASLAPASRSPAQTPPVPTPAYDHRSNNDGSMDLRDDAFDLSDDVRFVD
jgi:hypothetical protein